MPRANKEVIAICHNIRSAFNVGSIFRTAEGAGVTRIILGGYSAHPPHPKLAKTALGAEKAIPYQRVWHTWQAIDELKKNGYHIVALEQTKNASDLFKFKPKFPIALILGNEVKGLSKGILTRCDHVIEIPMYGQKESLNVSVAFGIAIYLLQNSKS